MRSTEFGGGKRERRVLAAMVTDDLVLGRVAPHWTEHGLFASPWANLIGGWCVAYHREYERAPGRSITGLFESWAEQDRDDDTRELVERFLSELSAEHARDGERPNSEYLADLAGRHFRRMHATRVAETAQGHVDAGRLEEAERTLESFSRLELGSGSGIDLFTDLEAMRSTYHHDVREPLIEYPGDIGRFFADQLGRDSFVAVMAPEKSGKSYVLLDLAYTAMCHRRRVAYFQAGDLSESQIKDRFLVRAALHPSRSSREDRGWPCTVRWPTAITPPPRGDFLSEPAFEVRSFDRPLDGTKGWEESLLHKVRERLKSKRSYLRLSCHPTKTLSVAGIASILDGWDRSGWTPDVVVVDYADILAPLNRKDEHRHQVKATWEELRKLSQTRHCLVLTATQADAGSYSRRTLGRDNFSENHLKYAEVTGLFGINVTAREKERQVWRANWLVRREGFFVDSRCLYVAGCLALASPLVVGTYPAYQSEPREVGEDEDRHHRNGKATRGKTAVAER